MLGGVNPQAYVHNPFEWIDLLGLSGCDVKFDKSQLQKKFKHAEDFGISGSANKQNINAFEQAMIAHINSPTITTGLNVMVDENSNFISGWKLSDRQIKDLSELRNVF